MTTKDVITVSLTKVHRKGVTRDPCTMGKTYLSVTLIWVPVFFCLRKIFNFVYVTVVGRLHGHCLPHNPTTVVEPSPVENV